MFAPAIVEEYYGNEAGNDNDDDDVVDDGKYRSVSVTSDSVLSFAEWFFFGSSDHHRVANLGKNNNYGDSQRRPPTKYKKNNHSSIIHCCSPVALDECDDEEDVTKHRATHNTMIIENYPYDEFVQCAKSSIDIISYVLDPLGDIFRGTTKSCIDNNDWNDNHQRPCDVDVHYNEKIGKDHCAKINVSTNEDALKSQHECCATSTTASSTLKCISSLDTFSTTTFSPIGVDMTTDCATIPTKRAIITDGLNDDDSRLGIAPIMHYNDLEDVVVEHDNECIARRLFVSQEDDFIVSFGTNVYRDDSCNDQQSRQRSKTLSQMLIETHRLLFISSSAVDRSKEEDVVIAAPSPDPYDIYCCQPRQRMLQEDMKFRKTPSSTSDPYAIYCCQPRARILHEKMHDKIHDDNNISIASTRQQHDKKDTSNQLLSIISSESNNNIVNAATTTTSTSTTVYTMSSGWNGDKLKRAKMKRRAKLKNNNRALTS